MTLLNILVYLSLVIFVIAIIARGIKIAKLPIHLRWELYPVPHEKGRAAHGGSMMEEVDHWDKKKEVDHVNELGVMIPEILFLKGVWEHNRPLWFGSWTLHFGLYLLIGNMVLLLVAAILGIAGVSLETGVLAYLPILIKYVGLVGFALGIIGSIVMFFKRATDKKLKMYNTPSHFFNIFHLGAIYLSGLIWVITDPGFVIQLSELYRGVITASATPVIPTIGYVHIASVLLFFVYLPFTHMTHFFTKYFTYHDVRWEDEPNRPGSKVEKRIKEAVSQPVSWAAPHVMADGKKTWADLVAYTGNEAEQEKENK